MTAAALVALVTAGLVGRGNRLATLPTQPILSATVSPHQVTAGGWTALTLTFTAGPRGLRHGIVRVSIPSRWTRPSLAHAHAGRVTTSLGSVTVRGRSVTVRGIDLAPGSRMKLRYGGGPGGATQPAVGGVYRLAVSAAPTPSTGLARLTGAPSVLVKSPSFGCVTAKDPTGTSRSLGLTNGIAQANTYNARASSGFIRQCYTRAGLGTTIALRSVSPVGPGPLGYLELGYGYHLLDQPFCSRCHSQPFPVRIPAPTVPGSYRATASYTIGTPSPRSLPYDLIYDLWVEQHPVPGVPPRPGDVEVIIFLYAQNLNGLCLASPQPASMVATIRLNGSTSASTWRICRIPGGTQAAPVAFFPIRPSPSSGSLSLALGDFVAAAGRYLQRSLGGYSLMGIELGTELDQCLLPAQCVASQIAWQWRISKLTFFGSGGSIPIVTSRGP